jgi:O-antigen ligase
MPKPKRTLILEMQAPFEPKVNHNRLDARLESGMFIGLTTILMWAPLAFGTTEPWSQFIQRTVALILLGVWVAQQSIRKAVLLSDGVLPALAFGLLVLFQLITGMTSYRYATIVAALDFISYGSFILIASEVFKRRRRLRIFTHCMAIYGFAISIFAISQGLLGSDKIFGLRSVRWSPDAIYGPYANHNHYAGFLEMLIPLAAVAALLERDSKRVLLLFFTVIMMLSVAFSRSRGGMVALAGELVFVCLVIYRLETNRKGVFTLVAIFTCVVVCVFLLGTGPVLHRISEPVDNYRAAMFRDAFVMATKKPILGFGLGTFSHVYPPFRSFYTSLFVNHVHNDYLELLVETGIVGLSFFGWLLVTVFRNGFRKIKTRSDREGGWLTLAALTGIVGLLIHSLVDFNLHIPANAAVFFVLCSAVAVPFNHGIKRLDDRPREQDPEFDERP